MPKKFKTRASLSKRIRITRTGKMIKRKAGQDHFNVKESGKTKRNKRRDVLVFKGVRGNIRSLMPS